MGIQETKRRQEEQLAAKAEGQQKQPSTQQQAKSLAQPVVDMQAMHQMMEDIVHTEFQAIPREQPQPLDMQALQQAVRSIIRAELQTMRDEQPRPQPSVVDAQALQHAVQSVVRAELQTVQTTLTLLTKAIQAQTDALMVGDVEEEENDDLLPTSPTHSTDEREGIEDEQVYPPDEELGDEEELDEALDDVGDEDEEGEDEEGYPAHPPRPESPTHRLRRPGPIALLIGSGDAIHPSTGQRRWEPVI